MSRPFLPTQTENRRIAVKASVRKILDQWKIDLNSPVLNDSQRNLIRRASIISAWCAEVETEWANSGKPLPSSYFRAVTTLNRIMETLDRHRRYGDLAA